MPMGSSGPHAVLEIDAMETSEITTGATNRLPGAKCSGFSRRSVLSFAGVVGAAAPFGLFDAARALTVPPYFPADTTICRAAASGEALQGAPRQLKLAWNANAACTIAAPVAKERGIFAKHNLDVEFVNFGARPISCWRRLRPARPMPAWGWRCVG